MRRGSGIGRLTALVYACLVFVSLGTAHADTRNWGGSSDGDWFSDGNWSENAVPADGDTVIVNSGSIILNASTADLGAFTIGAATITFTNWTTVLSATTVVVQSGGNITHATSATNALPTNTNRVYIVASNVTVQASGSISASAKGYAGGKFNNTPPIGEGPGGGLSVYNRGGGGGHGGKGGNGSDAIAAGGGTYGSATAPIMLGSGGGGGNAYGGAGGGAVRIEASGTVTVEGSILASGVGTTDQQGCGSGGSIYITCRSMAGSGTVSAAGGGPNTRSGGGGGGRIAIHYNPTAQASAGAASLTITVAGGDGGILGGKDGEPGTLHVTDTSILDGAALKLTGLISFDAATSWSPASLTVMAASPIFPDAFLIDVAGDFKLDGSGTTTLTYAPRLHIGGDLVMTNGGGLALYSPMTNSLAYGMLVGVTGAVSMSSGSVLSLYSNPTNGGSIKMVVSNLLVASGAVIDADGKGYQGSRYGVSAHPDGYGPGGGGSADIRGGGGGYGGVGAKAPNKDLAIGGPVYGSSTAPDQCGSGAGGGGYAGGNGGGLIWVVAQGAIHVDGDLDADGGTNGNGDHDGGGSGGGIYLQMATFSGGGNLVARGGGDGDGYSGGGGGGRIAIVDWTSDTFEGLVSVDPGKFATAGATGTIVRAVNASLKTLTVQGVPTTHGAPTPTPYGSKGFTSGAEVTNFIQQAANVAATTRDLFLTYSVSNAAGTVIDSGTATQTSFTVDQDLFLTYVWTNQFYLTTASGPNGGLQTDHSGWYTDSEQISVTATAAVDYAFTQWSGLGVPIGASTNNPLVLTMDEARDVQANFSSTLPMARTWNGDGTWFTPGNWTPAGIPGPNDTLTVNTGTLTIDNPSQADSMTVKDGATVVFANWTTALTVDSFMVESNGVVTHALCDISANPANTNRIHMICTSFTVAEGGVVDANAKGYPGGPKYTDGFGPGGGKKGDTSGGGGGYGGSGGRGHLSHGNNYGGPAYGTVTAPTQPGSGGAGANGASDDTGGNGGGVIRIEATGAATVHGTLRANGAVGTGSSRQGGGGSGGSIYITCNTFQGDGVLQAMGGNNTPEDGGGGGGRIAVAYDPVAQAAVGVQPSATFSARHATTFYIDDLEDGTLFLTDSTFLPANGAIFPDSTRVYGITDWSITSAVISNRLIRFLETGFNFRATGDLAITGSGGLQFNIAGQTFAIGGDLTLSSGGDLTLFSGPTNAASAWSEYGSLVDIDGTVTITDTGSSLVPVSDGTNGGSIKLELNDIELSSDGVINANGRGFIGAASTYGYGPGRGKGGVNSGGGGGYGGRGGDGNHYPYSQGGTTNGSEAIPLMPGSAGGGVTDTGHIGGSGGGLVWIEADTVTMNSGAITADGNSQAGVNGGAGSGGAIYIYCTTLDGTNGTLSAKGGTSTREGGGGGGGRIAVSRYRHLITTVDGPVDGGSGYGTASDPGTLYWGEGRPPQGSMFIVR